MVEADKAHSEKRREYSRTPVLRFCTSRVSVPDWKGALRAVRVHVPSQRSGKGREPPFYRVSSVRFSRLPSRFTRSRPYSISRLPHLETSRSRQLGKVVS